MTDRDFTPDALSGVNGINGSLPGGVKRVLRLLGDEQRAVLSMIGDNWRHDKFAIGDITNVLCEQVKQKQVEAGIMDVYAAMSLTLQGEASPRTVSYYARVADFYSGAAREQFGTLPFSHFNFAMAYPAWRDILQWASDEQHRDANMTAPSVEKLAKHYSELTNQTQEKGLNHDVDPAIGADAIPDEAPDVSLFTIPDEVDLLQARNEPRLVARDFRRAGEWLKSQLPYMRLPAELQDRLVECLDDLDELLREVAVLDTQRLS